MKGSPSQKQFGAYLTVKGAPTIGVGQARAQKVECKLRLLTSATETNFEALF